MKKIVVYGINQQAQSLCKMIEQEKQAEIAAFVVDAAYKKYDVLLNHPVFEAEEMKSLFPPQEYEVCLSFGYKNMVHNREEKFNQCKDKGYHIYSFISKNALVYSDEIGEGCNIYPGASIMPFAKIGKGCFLENGVVVSHNSELKDFNFLAPGALLCGDVEIGNNCFIGARSILINGCKLEDEVFVGAGAKISRIVKKGSAVLPAKSEAYEGMAFEKMSHMF